MILHAFQLQSEADYIAHRRLWEFLLSRMRDDLEPRGVRWGEHWHAQILSYRAGEAPSEAAAALQVAARSRR